MSKIEEALEKANRIRETEFEDYGAKENEIKKIAAFRNVEPRDVSNEYLVTFHKPDSPVTEEYRRLKSMLLRETKADFLNTIMVTSAVTGEGKSLTTVNLALTLAQEIDHSILLIDADLRRPSIHQLLGVDYEYGLSDYLTGNIDVSDILVKTGIGNLVIIPAGHSVDNPVELLSSDKMKNLLRELKQRYMDRYILLDTPPVLAFAEAISIGSSVDGIIFVVQERGAQKQSIENALTLLKDMKVLGVVFNRASDMNIEGHSSRYDYYGHKKKQKNKKRRGNE